MSLIDSGGMQICPDCGQAISQWDSHKCPVSQFIYSQQTGGYIAIDETTPALQEINETLQAILAELRELRNQIPPTVDK